MCELAVERKRCFLPPFSPFRVKYGSVLFCLSKIGLTIDIYGGSKIWQLILSLKTMKKIQKVANPATRIPLYQTILKFSKTDARGSVSPADGKAGICKCLCYDQARNLLTKGNVFPLSV